MHQVCLVCVDEEEVVIRSQQHPAGDSTRSVSCITYRLKLLLVRWHRQRPGLLQDGVLAEGGQSDHHHHISTSTVS